MISAICSALRAVVEMQVVSVVFVSTDQKEVGITSPADGIPKGDNFDIDYVAHEVGHQMGGNHTFSHVKRRYRCK